MTLSGLSPQPTEIVADALIGRTIAGKYRVLSRVGSGGMGAVYKAQQIALEKPVAVKVLHAALEVDDQFVQRFHIEAKAASMFDHPSSTRVMDFGEEPDGLLYIVMEFLEGQTLLDVLHQDFPLDPARVADILRQALAALAVAHERGILHRDIKPENIVILQGRDDEGHTHDVVKVCDFGIAKLAVDIAPTSAVASSVMGGAITLRDGTPGPTGTLGDHVSTSAPPLPVKAISATPSGVQITPAPSRAASHAGREMGPPITRVGLIIGTPEYMSPEQAQGEAVDSRSDLYSLGCVLYHLITGQPPFHGDTPLVTATLHSTIEAKKPSELRPDVDPTLERVCLRAMQKNPDDRYATARDMRADLRSLVQQHPHQGTEPQFLPTSAESSAKLQPIGAEAIAALDALGSVRGARPRRTGYVFGAVLLAVGLASGLWIFVRPSAPAQTGTGIEPSNTANAPDAAAVPSSEKPANPVASASAFPQPSNVPTAISPVTHAGAPSEAALFPKARASLQSVDTVENVVKGAVIRALQGRDPAMKGCYLDALKKSGGTTIGTVHLNIDIVEGRVANATLDDDLGQPALKSCVEHRVLHTAVDGASPGAKASATLSFTNDS